LEGYVAGKHPEISNPGIRVMVWRAVYECYMR
jgi:hypothetical protein